MIVALATAPLVISGFAGSQPKLNRFDCPWNMKEAAFGRCFPRSGSESHTDRS